MSYHSVPGSPAALMIAAIQSTARSMRNAELAEIGGCAAKDVSALLRCAVKAGVLTSCKVLTEGRSQNEYRTGPGFRTDTPTLKPPWPTIIPVRQADTPIIETKQEKPVKKPNPAATFGNGKRYFYLFGDEGYATPEEAMAGVLNDLDDVDLRNAKIIAFDVIGRIEVAPRLVLEGRP